MKNLKSTKAKNKFKLAACMLTSLLFLFLGVYTFVNVRFPFEMIRKLSAIIFISVAILQVFGLIMENIWTLKKAVNWTSPLINSGVGVFVLLAPAWFWGIIPELFGIWACLNGILSGVKLYISISDQLNDWFWHLIAVIVYLAVGISFIIRPLHHFVSVSFIMGIYFIMYSLTCFSDFLQIIFPPHDKSLKRRFRMVLPAWIAAFIPQKLLEYFNKKWDSGKITDVSREDKEISAELFIHLSEDKASAFGHCDICFDDTVISYGCYDDASNRLFGALSDGVMVFTKRDAYIRHCLEYEKKILVGFGLRLDKTQREAIRKQIDLMKEDMVSWLPDAASRKKHEAKDAASILYLKTGANFFKFQNGEFKTYFVVGTNCVKVADHLLGAAGLDAIGSGIITPGTYYSYLNNAFERKTPLIVSRKLYKDCIDGKELV